MRFPARVAETSIRALRHAGSGVRPDSCHKAAVIRVNGALLTVSRNPKESSGVTRSSVSISRIYSSLTRSRSACLRGPSPAPMTSWSAYLLASSSEPSVPHNINEITQSRRGEISIQLFPFASGHYHSSRHARHPTRTRMTLWFRVRLTSRYRLSCARVSQSSSQLPDQEHSATITPGNSASSAFRRNGPNTLSS